MRGLLRRANQTVLMVSLGITLLAALIAWNLSDLSASQMLLAFLTAFTMLPLVTLNSIRQAALRGLNKVVIGQLPEMVIQPMIFVSLIGASYLFLGKSLTALWALGINVVAVGATYVVGTRLLHKNLPPATRETFPAYETQVWARSALHLMLIACMHVINAKADIVMLGAIKGTHATGIYTVATKGAELITFILIAVNMALAPSIASLYAKKDMKRLQRLITQSARIILLISLPIGLGLIVFGHWFLLLFGQDFTQGKTALAILSTGQLVNAATGSVGLLLIMTGLERDVAIFVGTSALLGIIMNAFLIPKWGMEGAAIATATRMILWNILLAIWVYKRLGIHSTALGKISFIQKGTK
jgi:O-antigen/teichoic acid export membrane protein